MLDRGQVVAQGRHDDLVISCPLYAQLAQQLDSLRPRAAALVEAS